MSDFELRILEMLGNIKQEIGGIQSDVKATYAQAKMTNGRVTRLEERVDGLEMCRDTSHGAGEVTKSVWEKGYQIAEKVALLVLGVWLGKFGKK